VNHGDVLEIVTYFYTLRQMKAYTRRDLLRAVWVSGVAACVPKLWGAADRKSPIRLAHLLPSAAADSVVESARRGAALAADEVRRAFAVLGVSFDLLEREIRSAEQAAQETEQLVRSHGVLAIISALDTEAEFAAATAARRPGRIVLSTRTPHLAIPPPPGSARLFRVGSSVRRYIDGMANWLLNEKDLRRWFFFAAPDAASSNLVQLARSALEKWRGRTAGISLLAELSEESVADVLDAAGKQRADLLFLGLEGEALRRFLQFVPKEPPLTITGIAATGAMTRAPQKSVWPVDWHHTLERFGAGQLNQRFAARFKRAMDSTAWTNWAAVKLAAEAALQSKPEDAWQMLDAVEEIKFDGHKRAPLTFRADGQLQHPFYLIAPAEKRRDEWEVVAEVSPDQRPASR
jgi:branched-chain amino acid transport system substrate-binding protein